jgi:hypothetical protein
MGTNALLALSILLTMHGAVVAGGRGIMGIPVL